MRAFSRLLCLLAALAVVDAHLWVGQSVAWLAMIHDRSAELGFEGAVTDTFSGDHPCEVCIAIQEERDDRREQAPVPEASPIAKGAPGLLAERRVALFPPDAARPTRPRSGRALSEWRPDVPAPPPWLG